MVFWTNQRTPQIEAVLIKCQRLSRDTVTELPALYGHVQPLLSFQRGATFFKHCRGPMKRQPLAMPFQVLKKQPIEVPQWRGKASKKVTLTALRFFISKTPFGPSHSPWRGPFPPNSALWCIPASYLRFVGWSWTYICHGQNSIRFFGPLVIPPFNSITQYGFR